MFVGGLSWETTQESLQRYFGQYGEVIDCVVMKNSETGRSRGFGFVTFADPNKVDSVLKSGPHELDGRTVSGGSGSENLSLHLPRPSACFSELIYLFFIDLLGRHFGYNLRTSFCSFHWQVWQSLLNRRIKMHPRIVNLCESVPLTYCGYCSDVNMSKWKLKLSCISIHSNYGYALMERGLFWWSLHSAQTVP